MEAPATTQARLRQPTIAWFFETQIDGPWTPKNKSPGGRISTKSFAIGSI
jgi:hypothetical protein